MGDLVAAERLCEAGVSDHRITTAEDESTIEQGFQPPSDLLLGKKIAAIGSLQTQVVRGIVCFQKD
jgi:hypothetical protein